ncbi:MAG: hypothetical protein ACTHOM_05595 [Allomuricauda sp.]
MLNNNLVKVLSKVYRYENSEYDFDKKIDVYQIPDSLSNEQKEILKASNFELNRVREHNHDNIIKELKGIVENAHLEYIVSNMFIKAVGSGFNRGIQSIFSYYFAQNMPLHDFDLLTRKGYRTENTCKICGINKKMWHNDSENLYDLYIGYCRFGGYAEMLLDLKEVLTFKNITATDNEKSVFLKVIEIIENAPNDETPSKLIKRLAKEKCLPGSNNTSRVWIVKCLAELGILKNRYDANYSIMNPFIHYGQKLEWELDIHKNSPSRAEVEFPISAWRGKLGVNRDYVEKIMANAKTR